MEPVHRQPHSAVHYTHTTTAHIAQRLAIERLNNDSHAATCTTLAILLLHLTVCLLLLCWCLPPPAQVVEASGLAPVGEVLLVPDLSAAVPWVGKPGDIMAPVDMVERDLSEWQTYTLRYT